MTEPALEKEVFDAEFTVEDNGSYQVVKQPNELKKKVKVVGSGELSMKAIDSADKAIAELSVNFEEWMMSEADRMVTAWEDLCGSRGGAEKVQEFYAAMHDISGQAATFGYPFAGLVANSICRVFNNLAPGKQLPKAYVELHVYSIKAIVSENIKGVDHPVARQIAMSLDEMRFKYMD